MTTEDNEKSLETRTHAGFFPPEKKGAHSFSLQYTSVILIVLAFVIGAFAKEPVAAEQEVTIIPEVVEVIKPKIAGKIEYRTLFATGNSSLDPLQVEALREFLLSHDVSAEFDVFLESKEGGNADITLAVARSVTLYKYFVEEGVPATAVKVFAREQLSDLQATVNVYTATVNND